jgi:type II secretory pathway pseudopilin PulG
MAGYTLLEILLVVSVLVTVSGVAIPLSASVTDRLHASGAARYVASRIALSRIDAVRRATTVGLRFADVGGDYQFATFIDGNGNGLRASDITRGVDRQSGRTERLQEQFANAVFGLLPGIPDLDGNTGTMNGVRIGSSPFLSLAPDGSATSGTLYVHSRRHQYAIRILGATGRVRLFRFDPGAHRWISR